MTKEMEYIYKDEFSNFYIKIERHVDADGKKDFKAFRYENNQWQIGLDNKPVILYNLPAIIKAEFVFICEGEKCCDVLTKLGFVATTNPFGAGKWKNEFANFFIGKKVVVCEDNDETGKKHALEVIQSLLEKASAIKHLQFDELPLKGDIADWLKDHTKEELLTRIKYLEPINQPDPPKAISIPLQLVTLKDLYQEPNEKLDWIVEDLLSRGGLSVIAAKPKTGKSTIARQLALCVSRGEDFLGRSTTKGLVVYLAFEERKTDIKNHFIQMGANENENIKIFPGMAPEDCITHVRKMVEVEKPSLIIVDTLARIARIKDFNDYSQITTGLEPLLALAREFNAHVCLIHHAKKGDSKGIDSILGSTGLAASADTLLFMHRSEKYTTIYSIQRVGKTFEETVLQFDPESRWTSIGDTKEQTEINGIKDSIYNFLTNKEPLTESQIQSEIEGKRAFFIKALRELVRENKILRTGGGKRNDPYFYSISSTLVSTISLEQENQNTSDICIQSEEKNLNNIEEENNLPI